MSAPLAFNPAASDALPPRGEADEFDAHLPALAGGLAHASTNGTAAAAAAAGPGADFTRLYRIRPYAEGDVDPCRRLYTDGLLGGRLAANDSALDIDDIRGAYLLDPLNGFWVAEVTDAAPEFAAWLPAGIGPGNVVGMIGVQHHEEGVGEIRRLRVDKAHCRRGIGSRLLETAIRFCRDSGCLKVQLDTFVGREAAVKLFERFRFRHGRTRHVGDKELLYFYLDLYTQDRRDGL